MGERCKLPGNETEATMGNRRYLARCLQLLLSRKSQAHAQGFGCARSEHGVDDDTFSWLRVAVALVAARCLQADGALDLYGFNWAPQRQQQRQRQRERDHMAHVERLALEGMQACAFCCIALLM